MRLPPLVLLIFRDIANWMSAYTCAWLFVAANLAHNDRLVVPSFSDLLTAGVAKVIIAAPFSIVINLLLLGFYFLMSGLIFFFSLASYYIASLPLLAVRPHILQPFSLLLHFLLSCLIALQAGPLAQALLKNSLMKDDVVVSSILIVGMALGSFHWFFRYVTMYPVQAKRGKNA